MNRTRKTVPGGFYIRAEAGDVNLQAATADDGKTLRRFTMTAYTGGAMALAGWPYPVVVDLTGLVLGKKSRPILMNHDTARIVGHTDTVGVEGTALTVAGVISGVGSAAREVVGASDNGFPWQASLGAAVKKVVFVPEGKTAAANGKEFAGPVYMVRQAKLGEVSFVALGADDATTAKVEAGRIPVIEGNSNMEVMTMHFEKWVEAKGFVLADLSEDQTANLKAMYESETNAAGKPDGEDGAPDGRPVQAVKSGEARPTAAEAIIQAREEAQAAVRTERDRVSAIQEICGGEVPRIERDAIRLGWSVEDTSQKVLKAMRENRPQADVNIVTRSDKGASFNLKTLEAALCLRAGIDDTALVKSYGEQVVESALQSRDISLQKVFEECAELEGRTVPRSFGNDTIRAAFDTVSLPGILNNVANKKLLKAFEAQPVIATKICSEGELNDFKESERYRLTDVGDLEPVAPDGELKHGGLVEEKATNQLGTFGKIFALTREMIYNDDLAAFMKVPEGMGARAGRKEGRPALLHAPAWQPGAGRRQDTVPRRPQELAGRRRHGALRRLPGDGDPALHGSDRCRRPADQRASAFPGGADRAQDDGAGVAELRDLLRHGQFEQGSHPDLQRPGRRGHRGRGEPVPLEHQLSGVLGQGLVLVRRPGGRGHVRDRLPEGPSRADGRTGRDRLRHAGREVPRGWRTTTTTCRPRACDRPPARSSCPARAGRDRPAADRSPTRRDARDGAGRTRCSSRRHKV